MDRSAPINPSPSKATTTDMTSQRSAFSPASSSKRSLLSPSRHELPRWRSPSPMSASIIPPPIVQSTYVSSPRSVVQSMVVDRTPPVPDRQSELEADLQYLLDAQAEGLVAGLEGGLQDDATSHGSTTPTARSVRSTSGRRPARAVKRKPGLRSARTGLYNTMLALSAVKDDELHDISGDLHEKDERLGQIREWEKKKAGLQEAAKNVDSNEETVRVQRLREQAETVESEIRELERQLEDRRVLHRKLMRQATAVESEVQAKLASYTSSLKMLEEDVRKFLSITPQFEIHSSPVGDVRTSVWQLPPKRRTLELAHEQYTHERDSVLKQRRSVEHEKDALQEGAAVWKEVVAAVTGFEKRMRLDMRAQTSSDQSQDDATARLRDLLQHMDSLTTDLDTKLDLAKERNWNLLIAAIGAELDALRRGKELLEGVLGVERQDTDELVDTQSAGSGGEEIHGLDKSFETARRRRLSNGLDSSEDDPDPELLFSRQEIDT